MGRPFTEEEKGYIVDAAIEVGFVLSEDGQTLTCTKEQLAELGKGVALAALSQLTEAMFATSNDGEIDADSES